MMNLRVLKQIWANERGASAVEFVLVLPVLLLLTIGTAYLCFMMYAASTLHYAVEDAARCYAVKTAICSSVATTQAYALARYRGPGMSPALTAASFSVTTPTCGKQVSVTSAQFRFRTGLASFSVPISARACFPA
jgi:Flp pilus assembly protein TadG